MLPLPNAYREYLLALEERSFSRAEGAVSVALLEGADAGDLYIQVFRPALAQIGNLELAGVLPRETVHIGAAITTHLMRVMAPYFVPPVRPPGSRTVLGACVGEERHDLGLRMVVDIFRRGGWQTLDMGPATPVEAMLAMAWQAKPDLVALSATLSTQVRPVQRLIHLLRAEGIGVPVAVGGFPFDTSPGLWRRIGATFYAPDPRLLLATANSLEGHLAVSAAATAA